MNTTLHPPPPVLKNLIRYFWTLESSHAAWVPPVYQSMADSCAEMIFQYGGGFTEFGSHSAHYVAQKSRSATRHLGSGIGMFGIRFYPYAMRDLIRTPACDLSNGIFDLETIFGNSGAELCARIINAVDTSQRIRIAVNFFSEKIESTAYDPFKQIVDHALKSNGPLDIDLLLKESGLSVRQFERRFTMVAGFTPKYLDRILRFQRVKRNYITEKFETLSQLALASGYFDQSHFIKDFKEFSGMNPHRYFTLLANEESQESKIIRGLIIEKERFDSHAVTTT